jgi:hypothetical protein
MKMASGRNEGSRCRVSIACESDSSMVCRQYIWRADARDAAGMDCAACGIWCDDFQCVEDVQQVRRLLT